MGSITKQDRISGKTLQEAFRTLQKEDGYENGHDIYSGSWANCQGVREVSAEEFDRRVREDDISKFETAVAKCVVKPIGNTNKIKTDVVRHPNHGTRKWKTVYVAVPDVATPGYPVVNIMEDTLTAAINKARAYIEKNPDVSLKVQIGKKLEGADPLCAEVKYKRSSKERDGEWEIYGAMSW